jgi:hypothetical protein
MEERWKIWFSVYDINQNFKGSGVCPQSYKHKSSAVRAAKRMFGESRTHRWAVGKTNPYKL